MGGRGRGGKPRPAAARGGGEDRARPPPRRLDREPVPLDPDRTRLLGLWLQAFGPGTEADIRWWTGWTARDARAALAAVPHTAVEVESGTGYVLANDVEPELAGDPGAALLPALDPTTMGWKEREWYLGPHAKSLFDRNGNAGPTVWWEGRVVGGWSQRKDGEIAYRLLEDVGTDAEAAVAFEAESLADWLGDVRITPRFRTPLERELAA